MGYKDILRYAQEEKFAVPAFNYTDIWEFLAILEAAAELRAPVLAATAPVTVDAMGLDFCAAFGKLGYEHTKGNLYNHLDHCTSVDCCMAAVDAGYHSIMFDGSALPLEENIAKSKLMADYARARGVLVEAEVGQILGRSDEGSCDKAVYSVTQDDCIRMATETGITSLAIGIGNRHGFYDKKPNLNIALLADVHRELPIPLVLHGSSGLEDAVVKECIRNGISKVNVGTALHYAYKQKVAEVIDVEKKNYAVTSFAVPAKEAIKDVVRTWIRVCGAEGKAL